jgi:hypothetical protein
MRLTRLGPALVLVVLLLPGSPAASDSASWTSQGLRYLHGEGVPRDVDRAVVHFCAGAVRNDADAAFELGWLYLQGRGVARDESLAVGWFDRARELGASLPPALMSRLDAVEATDPDCVASDGHDLALSSPRRTDFAVMIFELAPSYGLDPKFVLEVVRAESNFNPRARSHKGAQGLMQLIPATARRFGVEDPCEPMQNLHGAMAYLRWLLNHFDGDIALALAGYNAGEQAVKRYGGIPPFNETREYVRRILQRYAGSRA